jgi:hypothetical protein
VKGLDKYNTLQCAVFDYDELVNISTPECCMLREGVKENFQPALLFVEIFLLYPWPSLTGVMYM